MRILFINTTCGQTSTGKICVKLAEQFIREGNTCKIAYGREPVLEQYKDIAVKIGGPFSTYKDILYTRVTGRHGFGAKSETEKFIAWANEYNPDLLWLHNIHGYFINIEELFAWIKSRPQMKVYWTLHDCWAFTGHCGFFSLAKCDKWKTGCGNCPQKREYPSSYFIDSSARNYEQKKECFNGVRNLTLFTPSRWLADLVSQSFLKDYPIEVHPNTIDTQIFKPTPSDFRKRYKLEDKIIVLGVANVWAIRKGLDDFIQLSKRLDRQYAIVLVGLSKKQIKACPKEIIGLPRTNSGKELAEIYSAADVYVNPSKEETFGLTTLEATSCGTPAVVYCDTACEEVANSFGGVAVPQSIDELYQAIVRIAPNKKMF